MSLRECFVSPDPQVSISATTEIILHGEDQTRGPNVFPVAFGAALADGDALAFVQQLQHLKLPRFWVKIPTWKDLKRKRIEELLDGGDFPKLRNVYSPGRSEPVTDLTPEEERGVRRYNGSVGGFLDLDPRGRQALYRCVTDGKGNLIEIWLSWFGMVEAFCRNRLHEKKKNLLARLPKDDPNEPLLFQDLDDDLKRTLSRELERLNLYKHGRSIMEMLLGVFGKYRRNPVEIPSEALRRLLWPTREHPKDWKETVERTLGTLRNMTIFYKAGKALRGEHGFISGWDYVAKGHGGHGEGVYLVTVDQIFFGTLRIFETAGNFRLRSGVEAAVYDFSKKISARQRKALNFVSFDAGRTFYHAVAGLTPEQQNFLNWLERQITQKRDPVPKFSKRERCKPNATDALDPRLFDETFCPFLPEGKFVAALGHFRRNPEAGFTLYGSASKAGKKSGAHVTGLVAVLGYLLPPGAAHNARRGVVRKALEDLKAVVVGYLGGVVVGKLGAQAGGTGIWLAFDKWTDLDEEALCRKLKVFVFLPPDWNQRRRERFEQVTGYRVTESITEAEAAAWGSAVPVEVARAEPHARPAADTIYQGEPGGWKQLGPLPNRLCAAMQSLNLKRSDIARIFGVSPPVVTYWLKGLKLGEEKRDAKPIPKDLAVLMVRWLETGQEPTQVELAARPSRSRTPRRGASKPALHAAA